MNINNLRLPAFFCCLLFVFSCNTGCNTGPKPQEQTNVEKKNVTVNPPAFNSDSANYYTKAQLDFGPRNMKSKGHDACGEWLIAKMKKVADTVYVQKFDATGFDGLTLKSTNIIASFNPQATTRILLCSHWDSRPWADQDTKDRDKPILSASDGASGIGTLMEIANAIRTKQLKIGVDLFFIDTEDYGYSQSLQGIVNKTGDPENSFCLGTQYWVTHPHINGYKADFGVLLDMAGARNAVFTREMGSSFNAGWVQDKVWQNGQQLGYTNYFVNQNTPAITDDHAYINQIAKIPTIDIIQYDASSPSGTFAAYWHTHSDNMDVIDKGTLEAVGKTLLYTVYQYDAEQKTAQ